MVGCLVLGVVLAGIPGRVLEVLEEVDDSDILVLGVAIPVF